MQQPSNSIMNIEFNQGENANAHQQRQYQQWTNTRWNDSSSQTQNSSSSASSGSNIASDSNNNSNNKNGGASNATAATTKTRSTSSGKSPQSKYWCFTLNNYTPEDENRLSLVKNIPGAYLIYGHEVGESGTPHLQGFVSFQSRKRLPQVIAVLGQCHCSMARSVSKSIEYCKKQDADSFVEIGIKPEDPKLLMNQSKRNDLESFKKDVRNGMVDMKTIREKHSSVYARYEKFVNHYVRDHTAVAPVELFPLRDWQANLNAILNGPVDTRKIIFLVDIVGNQGKSWFFRYYEQNHSTNCQIILPGKKIDMAFVLRTNNRVVLIDAPRCKQGDYVLYDFLEEIKNGLVFSSKYEPIMKRFKSPHVVVAMNELPNEGALSADRYQIIKL